MAAQIKLNKEPLKKYIIPYELFPTETGTAKPQVLHIYDTCIYIKYNLDVDFTTIDKENEAIEAGFKLNKVIHIGKNDIIELSIEEHTLLQLDKAGNNIEYLRPGITVLTSIGGYTIWFETFDKAVEVYNDLINWRY